MILALAWLTVSLPYVNAARQGAQAICVTDDIGNTGTNEDDSNNPFANTTEEKTPSGPNTLSEYIHEYNWAVDFFLTPVKRNKCTHSALYIAFHGELLSPPPEA